MQCMYICLPSSSYSDEEADITVISDDDTYTNAGRKKSRHSPTRGKSKVASTPSRSSAGKAKRGVAFSDSDIEEEEEFNIPVRKKKR